MILFEDDDAPPPEVRVEALEARILEMIEESALALGIEPTGWAWRCSECGKNVRPDNSFGHDGGPDLHCGPVGIAPEHARDAWRAVLAAIRGRQGSTEILGYVVDRDGGLYRYQSGEPSHLYRPRERDIAESFCGSLNRAGGDGPIGLRAPWRVAPVGPVVDLKPFGWGVIDKDGDALVQHVYRGRGTAEHSATGLNQASARMATPLPDAPFAAVQLFYVPPSDRKAEAVGAKAPRTCDACGAPIQGGNCCERCHAGIEANRERRLAEAVEAPAEQPEDVKALMGALKASMGMAPKRGRKR